MTRRLYGFSKVAHGFLLTFRFRDDGWPRETINKTTSTQRCVNGNEQARVYSSQDSTNMRFSNQCPAVHWRQSFPSRCRGRQDAVKTTNS